MPTRTNVEYTLDLDKRDQLARFRDEFVIDDPDLIYLDGNWVIWVTSPIGSRTVNLRRINYFL
jgi:hypothetical protein